MEFIEYPKALYRGDVMRVAQDADEEAALRVDGYGNWQAATEQATAPADPADPQPLDRDALKARAKELGIEHPKNISTEKLAELVAA
jgi:hypothetical protein